MYLLSGGNFAMTDSKEMHLPMLKEVVMDVIVLAIMSPLKSIFVKQGSAACQNFKFKNMFLPSQTKELGRWMH